MIDSNVPTEQPAFPGSMIPEVTGGIAPSVRNLLAPLLGMYGGQLLVGFKPELRSWGIAAVAASLLLLALRLRPRTAGWPSDGLQIAIGLLLGLPLALDVAYFKVVTPPWSLILLWAVSCALVILAVSNLRRQAIRLQLTPLHPLDRWDALVLVLLLLGALLLRLPAVETIPWGADPDEGTMAQSAVDAATGAARDPFATGWVTHPTLQFFFNGLWIQLFGRTFLAMRLPAMVMGVLAVAAIYLFARVGYGRRIAIMAGVLAMGSDVAIHFSRLGVNNISDTLFMAWTMAGLWAAGATGNPLAFAAAGFGLGFGQYYYFGARAIPFVVAANVLVWLIADRRGVWRARYLLLGGLLVTLVVAEPLIGYWLRTPGSVSQHMDLTVPFSSFMQEKANQLSLSIGQLWRQQIRDSLLVFTVLPDRGTFYNPPQALLHPLQAPLFLVGLLVVFARWRRPINQGLLAWGLIVLTLGSILMNHPAAFHRLLGIVPMVIVTVAIGIDAGAEALVRAIRWRPGRVACSKRTSHIIAGGVLVILTAATINYYFRIYNLRVSFKSPNQEAVTIAALEYEHQRGQGAFLLCTQDTVDAAGKVFHPPIVYVAGEAFRGCAPAIVDQIGAQRPLYVYFLTDQFDAIPQYVARFPGGSLRDYYRRTDGLKIMTRYAVEAMAP
jgi:4-amino-4-deoxy-L-arabinose transferase-like glycosyltransferase